MFSLEVTRNASARKVAIAILWPSFVSAGLALGFLYLLVDPLTIAEALGMYGASRVNIYSISFLFFWMQAIVASAFCLIFIAPTDHLNPGVKRSAEVQGDGDD